MTIINRLLGALKRVVELYIPVASFVIMFLVFVLQIFCRYALRQPVAWAYEVTVTCYLWMVLLGACYAQKENAHVRFTLMYDVLPVRVRAALAFVGNALILVAFVWMFVPSVKFIDFAKMQQTSVLKIGLNIVYLPFIPFMILTIFYTALEMFRQFRVFSGLASQAEIDALIGKPEHQLEAEITAEEGIE